MEVKEFVKTILKDVIEAVNESTNESPTHQFTLYFGENKKIEFDLAVILEKGVEGNIKAEVFKIVSGKIQGHLSEQVVNRIKFSILPELK